MPLLGTRNTADEVMIGEEINTVLWYKALLVTDLGSGELSPQNHPAHSPAVHLQPTDLLGIR